MSGNNDNVPLKERVFQVTDAIKQNNQPIFMFTWIVSIVSLLSIILASLVGFELSDIRESY